MEVKKALAPEIDLILGLNYNSILSNGLEFGFNMNVKASDDYRLSDTIPDIKQPRYNTVDAGISLSSPNAGWKLALLVETW